MTLTTCRGGHLAIAFEDVGIDIDVVVTVVVVVNHC